jgi:hypothetical protein
MPDEEKDGFGETLLGVVVLVALSAGGIFGARALYTKFFTHPSGSFAFRLLYRRRGHRNSCRLVKEWLP